MSRTLVIVGCGFPQLSLIRRARALGVEVVGIDMNPAAVGVPYCSSFERISTSDEPAIAAFMKKSGHRAITSTGSEVSVRTVAGVAAQLDLPFYASPEIIRRCQEKDPMRAGYQSAGLDVPEFKSCFDVASARTFVNEVGYPVVMKPARGWGQRGVSRVNSLDEVESAFNDALFHATAAGLPAVVVEAWITGREYSVNGWLESGELVPYAVTERITVPGNRPLGVMVAELYPSGLSASDEAQVIDVARRGAKALGHTRGPCYSQVALGTQGAMLFETAARMGGGFDADVTFLASGVDLYHRTIGIALGDRGLECEGKTGTRYAAAVAKFLIAKPGKLLSSTGLDDARALPNVHDAQLFVTNGGIIHPLTDSAKRAGYVLATGTSSADAIASADRALATLKLDVEGAS